MIIRIAPSAAPPSPRRLLYSVPAMVMGVAAILTGVWLLLVPVPQDRADARAYDAATSCVAGSARERTGDCLSGVPAVLEEIRSKGSRNRRVYLEVRREDGGRQEIRVPGSTSSSFAPAGTALRLVSWRGEIRHVNYGTGKAARTVFTEHDPRTAHRTPLGWALGLGPAGAALLWGGAWFTWFPSRSWRTTPWQFNVPVLGLLLLAVILGTSPIMYDSVRETLRWSGFVLAGGVAAMAAGCLYLMRTNTDTIRVRPRTRKRDRTFPALLFGDTSGPGGTPRHTHIVVGPGVLAWTNDPSGRSGRTPLPPGLVLERVRHPYATDPGPALRGNQWQFFRIAQCRDGDTEVLIAVERRAMPWLVGALTAPGSA
ncbi:hypothetical protein ACIA8F_12985 [Streptomyces sp. NPDC051563]|uniref:hypothetical protein n=1 Tax=Streptomyces sp. NPDC051563 TaxID=3365659 RepID=UPI0037B4DB89